MLFVLLSCMTLFTGEHIQLEDQEGFLVLTHSEKKCFEEFTSNELLEWERMAGKLENVFQKVFGLGDYYRAIPLERGTPAAMNVVPVGSFDHDEGINLLWEAKNTLWLIGGKTELLPPLQKEQITKIQAAAKEILSAPLSPIPLEKGKYPLTDVQEALLLVAEEWQKRFSIYYPDEIDPFKNVDCHLTTSIVVERENECTAFCKQEVVERQKVYEGKLNAVLVNFLPYTPEEHLLIIPKRHVEKISGSSDEEILEKYQLVNLFRDRLHELFPDKKVILFTKAGWKGNQTQNHLHDHLLVYDPDAPHLWMRNWLIGIASSGQHKAPTLSDQEINARRERLLPRI